MLKKVEFGPEATIYIRKQLSWGKTLADLLLRLPLEEGQVIAYLPTTASFEKSRDFETGGIAKTRETRPRLIAFISDYLSKPGKRYAVFEDPNAQVGDPHLQSSREQFFSHGIDVFSFLTPQDHDSERILYTVTSVSAWYFIGILTSIEKGEPDIQNRQIATKELLIELAKRTEHILIGAYDNEAKLIWSRK
jgi:hypothetical protein